MFGGAFGQKSVRRVNEQKERRPYVDTLVVGFGKRGGGERGRHKSQAQILAEKPIMSSRPDELRHSRRSPSIVSAASRCNDPTRVPSAFTIQRTAKIFIHVKRKREKERERPSLNLDVHASTTAFFICSCLAQMKPSRVANIFCQWMQSRKPLWLRGCFIHRNCRQVPVSRRNDECDTRRHGRAFANSRICKRTRGHVTVPCKQASIVFLIMALLLSGWHRSSLRPDLVLFSLLSSIV